MLVHQKYGTLCRSVEMQGGLYGETGVGSLTSLPHPEIASHLAVNIAKDSILRMSIPVFAWRLQREMQTAAIEYVHHWFAEADPGALTAEPDLERFTDLVARMPSSVRTKLTDVMLIIGASHDELGYSFIRSTASAIIRPELALAWLTREPSVTT